MKELLIVITNYRKDDDNQKVLRSVNSIDGWNDYIIIDDTGTGPDPKYYDGLNVIYNDKNYNSFWSRKLANDYAVDHGYEFIQFIDAGDELDVSISNYSGESNYEEDVRTAMIDGSVDLLIYPSVTVKSDGLESIYYSRLGDCNDRRTIIKSLLERSLSCSSCMKVFRTRLLKAAYEYLPEVKELYLFDLDDYLICLLYAYNCRSLASSFTPYYRYFMDGNSNTHTDPVDRMNRYTYAERIIRKVVPILFTGMFPRDVLEYWISDRLDSYFKRIK